HRRGGDGAAAAQHQPGDAVPLDDLVDTAADPDGGFDPLAFLRLRHHGDAIDALGQRIASRVLAVPSHAMTACIDFARQDVDHIASLVANVDVVDLGITAQFVGEAHRFTAGEADDV